MRMADDDEESVMQRVQGDDASSVGGSVMRIAGYDGNDDDEESVMQIVNDGESEMSGSVM